MAIENDVSTSSATAAWVRASVSLTSTSRMSSSGPAAVGGSPPYAVQHRPRHVPRLGVAERPLAGGPAQLAGRTGLPEVALPLPARHPVGHVAQQRLAELPHRLGAEPQLAVGPALEETGVPQGPLELLQGARVDGRLVAELAGELVEVDVVEPRAVVRLGELVGQVVEVGEVLQRAGTVTQAQSLLAVEPFGAAPVLARAAGPGGWRPSGPAAPSAPVSRTPGRRAASARPAARASSS